MGGEAADDAIFFLLTLLTVGPRIFEIYICQRQIRMYLETEEVPPRLSNSISQESFAQIRSDALQDEQLKVLRIAVYHMFVSSLELCLGLIPNIWALAEVMGHNTTFLKGNEVLIGIFFTILLIAYDSAKAFLWDYMEDCICQHYYLEEKYCNLSVICKIFICSFSKALVLIPCSIAVTLVFLNAGNYSFLWLWLYSCLILAIVVTVGWPLCILPSIYQIEPFPRGYLWYKIETIARKLNFPPMEILVAKRNILTSDSSVTTFAGVLCIKRIVISDDFLAIEHTKSLHDAVHLVELGFGPDSFSKELTDDSKAEDSPVASSSTLNPQHQHQRHTINLTVSEQVIRATLTHPIFKTKISYLKTPKRQHLKDRKISYSVGNIEALIIHELGHWKYAHNIKKMFVVSFLLYLWFALMGLCINLPALYEACGFEVSKTPSLAGCVIYTYYISGFIFLIGKVIFNMLSSFYEFEAESLIIDNEYNDHMVDLLLKRYMKHYTFPLFDVWYQRLYRRTPTLLARLEFLERNSPHESSSFVWWYNLTQTT